MSMFLKSLAAVALFSAGARADDLVNVAGASTVALGGYDPVAFFTDAKAINGSPSFASQYQGATYFFASEAHQRLFVAKPEHYAPQFGGFCAFGAAIGKVLPVDISTWQVRNDKLYLNLNPEILKGFNADFDANVSKAEKNWPELVKSSAATKTAAEGAAGRAVNVSGASRVALSGFDPVAFFTDSKAMNGSPFISAEHQGATYFFASEAHKQLFAAHPERYLPQFGGYCAYGVASNRLVPVDITTWQVRDGKLYLNLNPDVLKLFNADFDASTARAQKNWPDLAMKQAN
jgi:YHS domain-containing protein